MSYTHNVNRIWAVPNIGSGAADTLVKKQAWKAAGGTHVVIIAAWDQFQSVIGDSLYQPNVTILKGQIADAKAAGLQVIFEVGLQYCPAGIKSAVAPFRNHSNATWTSAAPGEDVRDWVFTQTGRNAVVDIINRLLGVEAGLSLSDFVAMRVGGGYYNECHYPRNGGDGTTVASVNYWGNGAAAQTGADLAAGLVPCPVAGYVPFSGTPARDPVYVEWYHASLAAFLRWLIAAHRTAGYTGTVAAMLPGFGLRTNYVNTEYRYRIEVSEGGDLARLLNVVIAANLPAVRYTPALSVVPYCTWLDGQDGAIPPAVDSDNAAWRKMATLARAFGYTGALWGENTGGNTNGDLYRMAAGALANGYTMCNFVGMDYGGASLAATATSNLSGFTEVVGAT